MPDTPCRARRACRAWKRAPAPMAHCRLPEEKEAGAVTAVCLVFANQVAQKEETHPVIQRMGHKIPSQPLPRPCIARSVLATAASDGDDGPARGLLVPCIVAPLCTSLPLVRRTRRQHLSFPSSVCKKIERATEKEKSQSCELHMQGRRLKKKDETERSFFLDKRRRGQREARGTAQQRMATGLKGLLEAAACLCGQRDAKLSPSLRDKPEQGEHTERRRCPCLLLTSAAATELLKARLQNRIAAYRARLGLEADVGKEDVERATGSSAFEALVAIHDAAKTPGEEGTDGEGASSSTGPAPLFGSRDLQTLRTLLSIVTQWYFSPLLASYDECLASLASPTGEVPEDGRATSRLQELPNEAKLRQNRLEQRAVLEQTTKQMDKTTSSLQNMLLGRAASAQGQKEVVNAVINTCASHILAIAIRLGYGPRFKPVAGGEGPSDSNEQREQARSVVINLLKT